MKILEGKEFIEEITNTTFDIASFYDVDVMEVAKDVKIALTDTLGIRKYLGKYSKRHLTDREIEDVWKAEMRASDYEGIFVALIAVRLRFELIKIQLTDAILGDFKKSLPYSAKNQLMENRREEVVNYFKKFFKHQ